MWAQTLSRPESSAEAMMPERTALEVVAWRLNLFGLGTGMFQSPNNSAIVGAVPQNRLGIDQNI